MSRIDREQAIAIIDELNVIFFYEANEHSREAYKEIRTAIEHLPTTEKTGKWINYKDEHRCSCCGEVIIGDWFYEDDAYSYCPNCGARMEMKE